MIESTNAILEVPITMSANERLFSQGKKQKERKNCGDLRKSIFRHYPLDQKAMSQLAPAFGGRGGGGGGGFFEGTIGVCSASA